MMDVLDLDWSRTSRPPSLLISPLILHISVLRVEVGPSKCAQRKRNVSAISKPPFTDPFVQVKKYEPLETRGR
jgi:hypothetical protein